MSYRHKTIMYDRGTVVEYERYQRTSLDNSCAGN